jgi:phosphatidylglycerol lysyltransferase
MPALHTRLAWLKDFVPLPVIEASHFLGSVAGIGLLLLARGLQQRLDVAYHGALLLLSGGVVFSLLKGGDYEEAFLLLVMLGALLPCRSYFYRKASLISERFSPRWIAAIATVLCGSVWLGLFAHKHVEYANELWWEFAVFSDAPRFLRATVGAFGGALLFAAARLLRPASLEPAPPGPEEFNKARAVIAHSEDAGAHLALLGDKSLLFSDNGDAFLMYGVEGRSWVALGDPVGNIREQEELVWRFRELCDQHGGWPVFYEVGPKTLPLYIDLGLTLLKLGEEARVDLTAFSLKGEAGKRYRHALNRVEKTKCTFVLIPADEVFALLPELRIVSDAWLAEKQTREKRFSLGFFSESYLKQNPVAVVRQEGKIVAFANLLLGADKKELSPDLMRYLPDAPANLMEYLFIQLMLWGQREGYRWFNLGMAPFSGFDDRALAPLWNRLSALVFRHGEHFYNFQGLRQYKEKFTPEWTPKYLACPGGFALPRILANVASLIAGGMKGVIGK